MNEVKRPSDEIMSALADCIDASPDGKRNALAQAIEDLSIKNQRTWASLTGPRHQGAFFGRLLDTIIETADARPLWEEQIKMTVMAQI